MCSVKKQMLNAGVKTLTLIKDVFLMTSYMTFRPKWSLEAHKENAECTGQ